MTRAEKPTLASIDEAVGLLHETLTTLGVVVGVESLSRGTVNLAERHDPNETTLGFDMSAVRGVAKVFDLSAQPGSVHKFPRYIHPDIPSHEGFTESGVFINEDTHIGTLVGVPTADVLLGAGKNLHEQRVLARAALPMTLSAYILEQAQRREADVPMLDTATVTRFPQIVLPRAYGDISSPRASWDMKLIIDRSDARAYEGAGFREMLV